MYKCENCGNTYKFIGRVKEEGNAYIYQNPGTKDEKELLTWAFLTGHSNWQSTQDITRCFYCKSTKITEY